MRPTIENVSGCAARDVAKSGKTNIANACVREARALRPICRQSLGPTSALSSQSSAAGSGESGFQSLIDRLVAGGSRYRR